MSLILDFPLNIIRTDRKKTASIAIKNEAVQLTVPAELSEERIEELIRKRTPWIREKLKTQSLTANPKPKEYIDGESFSYLGRNYRLKLEQAITKTAKLKNGRLIVNVPTLPRNGLFGGYIETSINGWYRKQALKHLREKSQRLSKQIGVEPKSIEVADFRARWGSCSPSGDLTYNWRIISASHKIIDYVVAHELCHLIEHNHSPRFWQLVERIIPDYRERREWLRRNGETLLK